MKEKILRITNGFEHVVVVALLGLLMLVVLLATVALFVGIVLGTIDKFFTHGLTEMKFTMPLLREVFTGFLMILIGLELMKTVVMYLDKHVVHVEVVMSVAMIAIARHVIDMDLATTAPLGLVGTAAIIFALAVGYFYFRKSVSGASEERIEN